MYRKTYDDLLARLRPDATWFSKRETQPVTVSDVVHLIHDKTSTVGILTHIGDEAIRIRDSNGDIITDKWVKFSSVVSSGSGFDRVNEDVIDMLGRKVDIGDWIVMSSTDGIIFGNVLRITPAGTVISDAWVGRSENSYNRRYESRMSNWNFVRLPSDDPGLDIVRAEMAAWSEEHR